MSESYEIPGARWRVWWVPQFPMQQFEFEVAGLVEGRRICTCLEEYDRFQFERQLTRDLCMMGGVQVSHPRFCDGDWTNVPNDDVGAQFLLENIRAEIKLASNSQPEE